MPASCMPAGQCKSRISEELSCSYSTKSCNRIHSTSCRTSNPYKSFHFNKSYGGFRVLVAQVSASGTLPPSSGFDDTSSSDNFQPQSYQRARLSPQALTRRIKEAETWHKLLLMLRSYQSEMDHIHICALLSRAAHLHGGSQSGLIDDVEREQYKHFLSDLVLAAQSYLDVYTARAVASTVYALAVLGVKNEDFLAQLADLAAKKFNNFNPQELANMIWGFAKQGYCPSGPWLEGFLVASGNLLWKFKPQELCNTIYSLALLQLDVNETWQDKFLQVVGHQLKNFKPMDFSNLAWALGNLQWGVEDEWMDNFITASTPLLNYFKPQELCNIAWGLAVLDYSPQPAWLSCFLVSAETKVQLMNPQDVAGLLWACARLGAKPSQLWVDQLLEAGSGILGQFKGLDLANLLWALSELDVVVKPQYQEDLILAVFDQAADQTLAAQDLSTILYVFSKNRWWDACQEDVYNALVGALKKKMSELDSAPLTNVLWALSRCPRSVEAEVVDALVAQSAGCLSQCDNTQLVIQLGALARLKHRPSEAWIRTWLEVSQARLPTFYPNQFADSIWALTELPTFVGPRRPWVDAFVATSQPQLELFTPAELSRTIFCMSKLDRHPGDDWLIAFESASMGCLRNVTPDQLLKQLDGVQKLRHQVSKKWLAHVGLAVQRLHSTCSQEQLDIVFALLVRLNKAFAIALYRSLPGSSQEATNSATGAEVEAVASSS